MDLLWLLFFLKQGDVFQIPAQPVYQLVPPVCGANQLAQHQVNEAKHMAWQKVI